MAATYIDVMNAYFTTNNFARDMMSAWNEQDPPAFEDYCAEKIREEYTIEQFINRINVYGTGYGFCMDDEMYQIVKEVWANYMSISDIEKAWNKYIEKEPFIMGDEKNYVLCEVLDDLRGWVSTHDDTFFSYDWGENKLIDKDKDPFFYHAELSLDDNGKPAIILERLYESESVVVELDSDNEKGLLNKMQQLAKEAGFAFDISKEKQIER